MKNVLLALVTLTLTVAPFAAEAKSLKPNPGKPVSQDQLRQSLEEMAEMLAGYEGCMMEVETFQNGALRLSVDSGEEANEVFVGKAAKITRKGRMSSDSSYDYVYSVAGNSEESNADINVFHMDDAYYGISITLFGEKGPVVFECRIDP